MPTLYWTLLQQLLAPVPKTACTKKNTQTSTKSFILKIIIFNSRQCIVDHSELSKLFAQDNSCITFYRHAVIRVINLTFPVKIQSLIGRVIVVIRILAACDK